MVGSVKRRGNYWYYSFELPKVNGKRRRIERKGGKTKGEARKALNAALEEYERSGKFSEVSEISCHDFFEHWFENYVKVNLKQSTQENYRNIIDLHIMPYLKNYKLKQVDPAMLQSLLHQEVEKGFAKKTISITKSVLASSFRRAVYPYQFIKDNPMAYVELPRFDELRKKPMKVLNKNEFEKLKEFVTPSNHLYLPMMIAYHTGMRRGEVCGLQWDMVSLEDKIIKVTRNMTPTKKQADGTTWVIGTPKTASSQREIDIGDTLVDILKACKKRQMENKLFYGMHYQDTNFVCTKDNGEPISPHSVKWTVAQAKEETGIDFDFHSFRHTHASILVELGVNMKVIQQRLGHSRITTTMDTYAHLSKDHKKRSADIFDQAVR